MPHALSLVLALHVLSAVLWVGGMFFAYLCLRPAAGALEPQHRLRLWAAVFERFFPWVWLSILILLTAVCGWYSWYSAALPMLQCTFILCSDWVS